ncbi:phosphatase PAP2 family protein [Bacillus sp. FJAT-45037]|uniref:phosphatase PAP2 family protein n=1 Tax=Bacillus sp. FJAT-45037 TaxID=2011007 RepID=UPI000C236626|nr:phosphatase PAP2 family protein [Bacillus sp. FJAT-45037]
MIVKKSWLFLYEADCQLFSLVNKQRQWMTPMQWITHVGGARVTVLSMLLLLLLTRGDTQTTAGAAACALIISHLIVMAIKHYLPRFRPYMTIKDSNVVCNPLADHSFPSGHTTAIFSICTPFMMMIPHLAILLLLLAVLVGVSRISLGLHYPSDVIVGAALGFSVGFSCMTLIPRFIGL